MVVIVCVMICVVVCVMVLVVLVVWGMGMIVWVMIVVCMT